MSQQPSNFLELSSHHYRRRCHDSSHKLPHISQAERQTHQTLGSGKPANAGTPDWPKPAYEGILPEGSLRMFIGHLAYPVYKPSKVQVSWDVDSYREALQLEDDNVGVSPRTDQAPTWKERFPPALEPGHIIKNPTVFVDREGAILCWFLPSVLVGEAQDEFIRATAEFSDVLAQPGHRPNPCEMCCSRQWFLAEKYYAKHYTYLLPGVVDISPVSCSRRDAVNDHEHMDEDDPPFRLEADTPRPADRSNPGLRQWMQLMDSGPDARMRLMRMCAIANMMLHFINHELYTAACEVRRRLTSQAPDNPLVRRLPKHTSPSDVLDAFGKWPTVFSHATITSNFTNLPIHRPRANTAFEVLVHTGGPSSEIDLPDIGARLKYAGGTVIVFCGGLLRRSKKAFGEQSEWAFSLNESVFELAGVDVPRWSYLPPDAA